MTIYLTLFYLLLTDWSSVRLDQPEVVTKGLTFNLVYLALFLNNWVVCLMF